VSKYPNSGTLNKNERKRPDKNDPDYEGSAEVDGVAYWLASWVKSGPNGKFLSISFKPKQAAAQPARSPSKSNDDEFDSDLPF
jgi:hypothetical protein